MDKELGLEKFSDVAIRFIENKAAVIDHFVRVKASATKRETANLY